MADLASIGRAPLPFTHVQCLRPLALRPGRILLHRRCCNKDVRSQRWAALRTRAEKEGNPLGSGELGRVPEDAYEFDEGAAQVQRLLQRDRKELMGAEEIGEGFRAEFDEDEREEQGGDEDGGFAAPARTDASSGASTSGRPAAGAPSNGSPFSAGAGKAASPFGKAPGGAASPFGAASSKAKPPGGLGNPFNGAGGQKLFSEMDSRLSPTMQPDAFEDKPWWQSITLGQVLIVLSFTLIISLMVGTFAVVYKLGGIRFNE